MAGTARDIRIFISYRRDDAGAVCGSIFRLLKQHFGAEDRVFRDVDSIEPGRPWDEAIDDAVGSCDVCLVLIGPRWLTATDDQGKRRLDDEEDRHRREIEVALERKVRLFPVLLEDTQMPLREQLPEAIRGLRRIQGWRIRDDQTFDWCVEQLIALIEKAAARDADRRREEQAHLQRQREPAEQAQRQAAEREDGTSAAKEPSEPDQSGELARAGLQASDRESGSDEPAAADPAAATEDQSTAPAPALPHMAPGGAAPIAAEDSPGGPAVPGWARAKPRAALAPGTITTIAGTGEPWAEGDGGPAILAALGDPRGIAATSEGGFLIADYGGNRVREVSGEDKIRTVAGTGMPGFSGDGGPATAAQLAAPAGVAATVDGGFLIADAGNARVRRVAPEGEISTAAGGGTQGLSDDGGPATEAQLSGPYGVAVAPHGGFLIADRYTNNRVCVVMPDGGMRSAAGKLGKSGYWAKTAFWRRAEWFEYECFEAGFAGDGGRATAAKLNGPTGVAATDDGGFLIADTNNNRVRYVSPAGTISTVAGTGEAGFSGDGGPAMLAQLSMPSGVDAAGDGGFLIADTNNHRVRYVSPAGTITTVAGTGEEGFSGDGGPATAAELRSPADIAVAPDGGFAIADGGNYRIRLVARGWSPSQR